jgi:hypothetical protein
LGEALAVAFFNAAHGSEQMGIGSCAEVFRLPVQHLHHQRIEKCPTFGTESCANFARDWLRPKGWDINASRTVKNHAHVYDLLYQLNEAFVRVQRRIIIIRAAPTIILNDRKRDKSAVLRSRSA